MEEVVGLEPTHVGFAIRGITSFAIAPKKLWYFCVFTFIKKSGRGQGIRTLGGFHLAGFQNRYNRPTLSILYNLMVRMVRIELTLRNRNGILSPARLPIPPHSHLSGNLFKLLYLNWTGIIIDFFYLVKGFLKKFQNL